VDIDVPSYPSQLHTKGMASQTLPWKGLPHQQHELWEAQLAGACSWTSTSLLLHLQNPLHGCSLI